MSSIQLFEQWWAKVAHMKLEKQTGQSVISSDNATMLHRLSQKKQQDEE